MAKIPAALPSPVIGKSPKILKVFKGIKKLATKEDHILISGEPGTCKELVAKAIHLSSPRKDGPFIVVSIPSVMGKKCESELFGGGRGEGKAEAAKHKGRLLEARGGTIFLDELTALDTSVQERLCSFFSNGKDSVRTGQNDGNPDVRLIGGATREYTEKKTEGDLLKGLCKLFSASHLHIPPLRDRKEDILPLAAYFLNDAAEKIGSGPKEIAKDAKALLEEYDWPGNVEELEVTMKRAAVLSNDAAIRRKDIFLEDLGGYSIKDFLEKKLNRYLKEMTKLGNCNLYETVLSEAEKALIEIVLRETNANQLKAARTLGINRNTLRAKIRGYKIKI